MFVKGVLINFSFFTRIASSDHVVIMNLETGGDQKIYKTKVIIIGRIKCSFKILSMTKENRKRK